MKKLNGNIYFNKTDINNCKKESIYYLNHPDDKYEFLYIINSDELKCVLRGIESLHNTLSWEFTTETAINLNTIDRCYKSLRIHSTSLLSYDEYYAIRSDQRTTYSEKKFSNWLQSKGHIIFYDFLKKS
jgi:hypothetical protein